jgi:3-phenylpropionate/trans-cinnamate dioxygenase ferredoxin subunit
VNDRGAEASGSDVFTSHSWQFESTYRTPSQAERVASTSAMEGQQGGVMSIRIADSRSVGPGQMQVFVVGGSPVNVANVDGHLYAIDDTCTHLGCSLAQGELDGTTVTCPCHGSQFDVTSGAVLRGPAREPVRSHPVHVEGSSIVVEG